MVILPLISVYYASSLEIHSPSLKESRKLPCSASATGEVTVLSPMSGTKICWLCPQVFRWDPSYSQQFGCLVLGEMFGQVRKFHLTLQGFKWKLSVWASPQHRIPPLWKKLQNYRFPCSSTFILAKASGKNPQLLSWLFSFIFLHPCSLCFKLPPVRIMVRGNETQILMAYRKCFWSICMPGPHWGRIWKAKDSDIHSFTRSFIYWVLGTVQDILRTQRQGLSSKHWQRKQGRMTKN